MGSASSGHRTNFVLWALFLLLAFTFGGYPDRAIAAQNWKAPDSNGPCGPTWFPSKAAATACINNWVAVYKYTVAFMGTAKTSQISNGYTISYGYYYSPYTTIGNYIVEYRCNQNANWSDATHSCVAIETYKPPKNLGNGAGCDGGEGGGPCQGDNGAAQGPASPTMAGDPINTVTGNKYEQEEDFSDGSWLVFRRFYNSSSSASAGSIGANWRSSFDRSLNIVGTPATTIILNRPDGKQETFLKVNGAWTSDPDIADIVTETANDQGALTGYVVFIASLRHYETYSVSGVLQSVVNGTGQGITLTYSTSQTPLTIAPGAGFLLTVTSPTGRSLNFSYNIKGQLAALLQPDGSSISYAYDSNWNLISTTYPDHSVRQYVYGESSLTGGTALPNAMTGVIDETGSRFSSTTYNSGGQATSSYFANNIGLTTITYKGGGSSTIEYPSGLTLDMGFTMPNGMARVASLSQPCGRTCAFLPRARTYDANGYESSSTDFNGVVTATTYGPSGLLTQRTEAQGRPGQRTTNFTWDLSSRVPLTRTVIDENGNLASSTSWTYNDFSQPLARCEADPTDADAVSYACGTSSRAPLGVRQWSYTYCNAIDSTQCPLIGLLLTTTGPRTDLTQTTSYSYYMIGSAENCGVPGAACYRPGDLKTITDALGHVTTIASYDANGRVTRVVDTNGVAFDTTYTPRGWVASRTIGNATTTFNYTPYGAVASVTDPDHVSVYFGYDEAHRLTKVTDALGNYIRYTLDATGNTIGEQIYDSGNVLRKTLSRTYDALGQVTQVSDGLSRAIFTATYVDSYDANGNLTHAADALGIQRKRGYDAVNRLVSTIEDYNGTDIATQNAQVTIGYDALDSLKTITDPDGLSTNYDYDGLGNRKALRSPDTGTSSFQVDAAGNRIQETDAQGIVRTIAYDVLNRPITFSYVDTTQNATYHYDEADGITGCIGSFSQGRLTRIVEANVTTTYCYSNHGNITKKTQVQNGVADIVFYTYTAADRLSSIITPSQTIIQYDRDGGGRISQVNVTPNGSATQAVVSSVGYLPFGPITNYTLGNGQAITRSYDTNYRLSDLTSPLLELHFVRDAMGNITALGNSEGEATPTETYDYDSLHRLIDIKTGTGASVEAYTYNKTGDRLSKTAPGILSGTYTYKTGTHQLTGVGTTVREVDSRGNTTVNAVASGTLSFDYNQRGRLTVVRKAGVTVGTYVLDALGQRVAKTVGTVTSRFDYNEAGQLVSESTGNSSRDYVWLGTVPVGIVDRNGSTVAASFILSDGLGTPRVVADSRGEVLWQWPYASNPFGEQAPTSSVGYTLNLRFPGQYFDAESGLDYNLHRDYEPATGRFLQSDPLGLVAGASTYGYVHSRPLNSVDPSGLQSFTPPPPPPEANGEESDPEEERVNEILNPTFGPNEALPETPIQRELRWGSCPQENALPENPGNLRHIFRDASGHFADDTAENRDALTSTANNPDNYRGQDAYGNGVYTRSQSDGTQIWVTTRGGVIQNGGVNNSPAQFTPGIGLSTLRP